MEQPTTSIPPIHVNISASPSPEEPENIAATAPISPPDAGGWFAQLQAAHASNVPTLTEKNEKPLFDVGDTALSVLQAPYDAVNNLMDFSYSTGKYVTDLVTKGPGEASFAERKAPFRLPERKSETLVGEIANTVMQWGAGFGILSGVSKGAKAVTGITQFNKVMQTAAPAEATIGNIIGTEAKDAAANILFGEREAERLGNFFKMFPGTRNTFLTYTAHKGDDTVADNALDMALEGLGMGTATRVLGKIFKYHKLKANGAPEEAMQKAIQEINDAVANPKPAAIRPRLTTEQLLEPERIKGFVRKAAQEESPFVGRIEGTNLDYYEVDVQQSHLIAQVSEAQADNMLRNARKEGHQKIINDCYDELEGYGLKYREQLAQGKRSVQDIQHASRVALQIRNTVKNLADYTDRIASKIQGGISDSRDLLCYAMASKDLQEFIVVNADIGTASGRLLNARKITVTDKMAKKMAEGPNPHSNDLMMNFHSVMEFTEKEAQEYIAKVGLSPEDIRQVAIDHFLSGSTLGKINAMKSLKPEFSFFRALLEFRCNNLLSGLITHSTNLVGNVLNLSLKPSEKMIGAALTGDKEAFKKGARMLGQTASVFYDSFRMAGKAWKVGDNILDRGTTRYETLPTQEITFEKVRNRMLSGRPPGSELTPNEELFARSVGWLGDKLRYPTRLMMTADELCKQIAFRTHLHAELMAAGERQGLSGEALEAYVAKRKTEAFMPDGAVAKGELTADSLQYSREATWTEDLTGVAGKGVQQFLNNVPAARLIVPFHKTPTNLFYDFLRHVPYLAPGSNEWKQMTEAFQKGGEARADVLGRISTGAGFMTLAYSLALEGRITGAPPLNPKIREQWETLGIKPYSIKIGDTWWEYRRYDPIAMLLSTTADVYTAIQENDGENSEIDEKGQQALFMGCASLIRGLGEKSYLQGITEFINVVNEPEKFLKIATGRFGSTLVPYAGALRFHRNIQGDGFQREMESVTDYIKNTSSLFNSDLPLRYNWITGQPVSSSNLLTSKQKPDLVVEEMLRLGTSVTGRPAQKVEGVEIDKALYSRLCELHGTVKLGGMTMHEALEKAIQSSAYDLKREHLPDGDYGADTPRSKVINKIIGRYREVAEKKLILEHPELMDKIKKAYILKQSNKAGLDSERGDKKRSLMMNLLN